MTVQLVGTANSTYTGTKATDTIWATRFISTASGVCSEIKIYSSSDGFAKVGIYLNDDATGNPDILLNANNTGTAISVGWNTITIPNTYITTGNYYWIAAMVSATILRYRSASGTSWSRSYPYSSGLPSTAGTGSSGTDEMKLQAWGNIGIGDVEVTFGDAFETTGETEYPAAINGSKVLCITTAIGGNQTVSGVTLAGQALSLVDSLAVDSGATAYAWIRDLPSCGENLALNVSLDATVCEVGIWSLTGIPAGTDFLDSDSYYTTVITTPDITLSAVAGGLSFSLIGSNDATGGATAIGDQSLDGFETNNAYAGSAVSVDSDDFHEWQWLGSPSKYLYGISFAPPVTVLSNSLFLGGGL